jgi:CDP-glucose 4,6-dehydratase
VLVTGHTGFKGSWLSLWLSRLGATVHGYALDPPTQPSLFEVARVGDVLASDTRANLADRAALDRTMAAARPEIVLHLAAQPLVAVGYREPIATLVDNVVGTANLLEAVRAAESVRAVVAIATDKVYLNSESGHAYTEDDPLGGHDPYSASKAAAEIVVASLRASFFGPGGHPARIATARAGNVIGGGDWAPDRLVPDCLRAFAAGVPVRLRRPGAVRPWQHVLDPLRGYLSLAAQLLGPEGDRYSRPWNFGPDASDEATAGDVAGRLAQLWGSAAAVLQHDGPTWSEVGLLRIDSKQARSALGWRPRWTLQEALDQTVAWHLAWCAGADMQSICLGQIAAHDQAIRS